MAAERCLQHREAAGLGRQALDGAEARAVGLHGEREARARGRAVDLDRTGAAHAMLAADMRAGEAETVAQEIGEQHARLGLALDGAAVDFEANRVARVGAQARHLLRLRDGLEPKLADKIAAIGGGRVQVVTRIEFGGEGRERVVARIVEIPDDRPVRDAADREAHAFLRRDRRAGHNGEIAVTARELAEREAFAGAAAGKRHGLRSVRHRCARSTSGR